MTSNPLVRKLTFTGSTETGRALMRQSADTIKKPAGSGGNAPFIVFDDADLDAAVEGALVSKFRNAGQTCVCANRIYVQAGVYDAFADKLAEAVRRLKVGNGMDEGVEQGPLIDDAAVKKVQEHLQDAVAKGARILTGGKPHALGGTFFEPTVLTGATPQMQLARRDVRPGRAALPVRIRRRGRPPGQRHRVRPGELLLQPRHPARLARRRIARIRHRRHQHRLDLERGRPVRRREAVGPGARRLALRHR